MGNTAEDDFGLDTRIVNAGYADEDGDIEVGLRPKLLKITSGRSGQRKI